MANEGETSRALPIGVVLSHHEDFNVPALEYLVLQLNKVQSAFELEFLSAPQGDDLIEMLQSKVPAPLDGVVGALGPFRGRFQEYVRGLSKSYDLEGSTPGHFIVISMAHMSGNYYSTNNYFVAVLALGNWKRTMAPPSILEFILTMIVREAAFMVAPTLPQHLGTRGCLFDFTPIIEDVRQKVLSGFICSECRSELASKHGTEVADDFSRAAGKEWLGASNDPHSPAGIAANLGHDLFLNKGLKPTTWETVIATAREEGVKQIFAAAGLLLVAALIFYLGLQAK